MAGRRKATAKSRKESFYSRALEEAERLELEKAQDVEGLDEEIAILRLKLKQLMQEHPEEIKLHLEAASTLARLVKTRYHITREAKNSLKEAIRRVLTEIAIPLGVKTLVK